MSWAWLVPLCVGALGAAVCAKLTRAVQRETARVKLARIELTETAPRLRADPVPSATSSSNSRSFLP